MAPQAPQEPQALPDEVDAVVVGAGLAGLACARELRAAGRSVVVVEAGDAVGGRVRTDRVDGYLVDRGFQLLNPSYPALRHGVDVAALRLGAFGAGVATRAEDGALVRLGLPWREPALVGATLAAVGPELRRLPGLLRWAAPMLPGPSALARHLPLRRRLDRRADMALVLSLDHAGVDGLLRRVIDAFYAGVLLDDAGETSTELARLLASSFLAATPGLPRDGMQALPDQLAAPLAGLVHLGVRVEAVRGAPGGQRVETSAGAVTARVVVVAAGPGSSDLTGQPDPGWRGVVTQWFSCDVAPTSSDLLHVDARTRPTGPLVNTAVVSHAAPSYAPPGRALVQASALVGPDRPRVTGAEMERHARELLGADPADRWNTVARHEVPQALPRQVAPLDATRTVVVREGLLVAGDHRDTASIQGALVSGRRAARAALSSLA